MLLHFLKIAFRNMWKYKSQTLISVIGLAVGFTCFALSALWIRYEMTFDSFHKDAKQMYVIYTPNVHNKNGYSSFNNYRLPSYLRETFPEIADAIPVIPSFSDKVIVEGVEHPVLIIKADSSFFRMFSVRILTGNRDFLIPGSNKLAITQKEATQLFGNENPVGKTVNISANEREICAVVSDMSKRSRYAFDLIMTFSESTVAEKSGTRESAETIIKLFPGTNIKSFEKKLYEDRHINKMIMRPVTKLHYTDPDADREVKFQHIVIFAVSGLLVILSSLFNYLSLFVSRFRIRQKELALRMVCGASGGSLMVMLSVEFMLTLLIAVLLGGMLTQWLHKPFLTLSGIQMDLPAIYSESLMYTGAVILISLLLFWLILFIFRKRSLNLSIRKSNRNLSRKVSVVAQLVISIAFAFCAIVILKQMYFLHHSDELGFSFKNTGSVTIRETTPKWDGVLANYLKQIPEITQVVDADGMVDLLSPAVTESRTIGSWDDRPGDVATINIRTMYVSPKYTDFYNFKLLAGEMLTDDDSQAKVLLNESAAKVFGWTDPVGKHFGDLGFYKVKGVIKNIYNLAPTIEAKPFIFFKNTDIKGIEVKWTEPPYYIHTVLFKYKEDTWKSCKEKIEQLIGKKYANSYHKNISNSEEVYDKFLKSENALIKLLSFVSAICIVICVFGFVSMVSLTCEERRKAIAIRKINGATVGDILSIFAKEYFLLLIIGAVIAFPVGYFIMKRWLEQYVKQTNIPAWIYLSILFVLALIIVLSVGWQVYKTSVENPAEVVKKE